jgi:hypothetical protein
MSIQTLRFLMKTRNHVVALTTTAGLLLGLATAAEAAPLYVGVAVPGISVAYVAPPAAAVYVPVYPTAAYTVPVAPYAVIYPGHRYGRWRHFEHFRREGDYWRR